MNVSTIRDGMLKGRRNSLKIAFAFLGVFLFRLFPHPPNTEIIMSTIMPYSKKFGWLFGGFFTLLIMFFFDLITGIGFFSLITIPTYVLISVFAGYWFKNRKASSLNFIKFSFFGTLFYDIVTGFGVGMGIFKQTFLVTLIGQIPFTIIHLMGNLFFAGIVSPLLYNWVVDNEKLEWWYNDNRCIDRTW